MIKRSDVLATALSFRHLDAAVRWIQLGLGIERGDVAGQEFSAQDSATYNELDSATARAEFLRSWLVAELFDAAYRAENDR